MIRSRLPHAFVESTDVCSSSSWTILDVAAVDTRNTILRDKSSSGKGMFEVGLETVLLLVLECHDQE